jgi:hypothetical protein
MVEKEKEISRKRVRDEEARFWFTESKKETF